MTRNQLQYWADRETARSNQAREVETQRSNFAKEMEDKRHHQELERLTEQSNLETARANAAKELLTSQQISETIRSNQANEVIRQRTNAINYGNLEETIAHNRAQESTNLIQATAAASQATASQYNAATNRMNAETQQQHVANTKQYQSDVTTAQLLKQGDELIARNLERRETERANRAREQIQRESTIANLLGNIGSAIIKFKLGGK